ncbi:hypothetical protein GYMLUDRAFT_63316 [Collybiopsis luxurians FD-317 M1]|uniref:Uncharacterized protein n=1 Tax=Collybiopsis luxurians FD-317 M1 TaxID=944289 RepID=A0A0D0CGR4_9AGAR|nr:hypothetical protein GYMLUDRAFT_63316 [Collybiopsis luxurians FD-317 M1]
MQNSKSDVKTESIAPSKTELSIQIAKLTNTLSKKRAELPTAPANGWKAREKNIEKWEQELQDARNAWKELESQEGEGRRRRHSFSFVQRRNVSICGIAASSPLSPIAEDLPQGSQTEKESRESTLASENAAPVPPVEAGSRDTDAAKAGPSDLPPSVASSNVEQESHQVNNEENHKPENDSSPFDTASGDTTAPKDGPSSLPLSAPSFTVDQAPPVANEGAIFARGPLDTERRFSSVMERFLDPTMVPFTPPTLPNTSAHPPTRLSRDIGSVKSIWEPQIPRLPTPASDGQSSVLREQEVQETARADGSTLTGPATAIESNGNEESAAIVVPPTTILTTTEIPTATKNEVSPTSIPTTNENVTQLDDPAAKVLSVTGNENASQEHSMEAKQGASGGRVETALEQMYAIARQNNIELHTLPPFDVKSEPFDTVPISLNVKLERGKISAKQPKGQKRTRAGGKQATTTSTKRRRVGIDTESEGEDNEEVKEERNTVPAIAPESSKGKKKESHDPGEAVYVDVTEDESSGADASGEEEEDAKPVKKSTKKPTCKGEEAWKKWCLDPDANPLPKSVKARAREVSEYCPQLATTCQRLSLEVLTSDHGTTRCLAHTFTRNKKQHNQVGSVKGYKATGIPRRPVLAKEKPEPGFLHCGCSIDTALMEFYFYKTGKILCEKMGPAGEPKQDQIEESWCGMRLLPRQRVLVFRQIKNDMAWNLDCIWERGENDEGQWVVPISPIERQVKHITRMYQRLEWLKLREAAEKQDADTAADTAENTEMNVNM